MTTRPSSPRGRNPEREKDMSDIFLTALQSAFSDAMKTALAAEIAQWHAQHSKNMDELATRVEALEAKILNLAVSTTTAGHLGDEQLDTIAQQSQKYRIDLSDHFESNRFEAC